MKKLSPIQVAPFHTVYSIFAWFETHALCTTVVPPRSLRGLSREFWCATAVLTVQIEKALLHPVLCVLDG